MNWKKKEANRLRAKIQIDPEGRSPMIMSDVKSRSDGACTVVSQYGGTVSA
jgi:hypothetical protein